MRLVPGQQQGAENSVAIDAYNVAAQRGLSSQDIAKQITYNGVWKFPTPGIGNGLVRNILGGCS